MKHHGTGNYGDRLYILFSYTILMMHVEATIVNTLVIIMNGLKKTICFEDAIIRNISINSRFVATGLNISLCLYVRSPRPSNFLIIRW